jgi:hypothetical protein
MRIFRRAAPRPPSLLTCLATLLLADLALHAGGLRRAVRSAQRFAGRPPIDDSPAAAALVAATVHRVAVAASLYPRRALCLEQSLALHVLLARRGVSNELRIGVRQLPFYAHAWVEHRGRPINEREEFVRTLAPFPSVEV